MSITYGGGPVPVKEVKASEPRAPKPETPKAGATARRGTGKTAKK